MASSTINPPQSNGELTVSGIDKILEKTAPSITASNGTSDLQELDASKLTFTRTDSPKAVPEPGSAAEAGMAAYVDVEARRSSITTFSTLYAERHR